jgi:hypothetical protein
MKFNKNLVKILVMSGLSVMSFFLLASPAFAGPGGQLDFGFTEQNFLNRIFQIAFGIGIGSGVVLIGVGGLTIATAAGNPEKIQAGRDQITSALIGLFVVIFSLVILKILGVDLLGLPNEFWNQAL